MVGPGSAAVTALAVVVLLIGPCGGGRSGADDTSCEVLALLECESQVLQLADRITGTTFDLVYASDRVPGRQTVADWDAREYGLGGWTLSVHHRFQASRGVLIRGDGRILRVGEAIEYAPEGAADDTHGLLVASEDGSEIYHFDHSGRHLRTLDGLTSGVRFQFEYDTEGRLASIVDGSGNTTVVVRAESDPLLGIDSPLGVRTSLVADADGYLTTIENPAEESLELTYAEGGLLTETVDPNGQVARYEYDEDGRLAMITDADGHTSSLRRSSIDGGHAIELETAMGRVTRYEFTRDGDNLVRRRTDPDGRSVQISLTDDHRSVTLRERTTFDLKLEPDPRWQMQAPVVASATLVTPGRRRTSVSTERTAETQAGDDVLGLVRLRETSVWDGRRYSSEYEGSRRSIRMSTPEGRDLEAMLDGLGRVVAERGGGLASVTYAYDVKGRLGGITEGQGPDARTTTISHESGAGRVSVTDPLGRMTHYRFDAAGRLVGLELPGSRSVSYFYDATGNPTGITPPERSSHLFGFSQGGLPSDYVIPRVGGSPDRVFEVAYDRDAQPERVDLADGRNVRVSYDDAGRPIGLDLSRGRIVAAYDDVTGLPSRVTAPGEQAVGYQYDGGLMLEEEWSGPVAGRVGRLYGDRMLLSSFAINSDSPVPYAYDDDGHIARAGALRIERDPVRGFVTKTSVGSLVSGYQYDAYGELAAVSVTSGGTAVYSTAYRRDRLGRIVELDERLLGAGAGYTYRYDEAGRLSEVRRNGSVWRSFTYDANGNRIRSDGLVGETGASYDDRDRLVRAGASRYQYRASGELALSTASTGTTRFEYDELGNLMKVALPDGRGISYEVDGVGRRIGKRINGKLISGFLYLDDLRPAAQLDGRGRIVSRFVYASDANVPDYFVKNGRTYYMVTDHLGSPRLVVDAATGTVAERIDYDPYGVVLQDTNPGFQPFGFAGGLYDPDTGLIRFGARDYDAVLGRWTAPDPILFDGDDVNLYAYGLGDPVNVVDSTGLTSHEWSVLPRVRNYNRVSPWRREPIVRPTPRGDPYRGDPRISPWRTGPVRPPPKLRWWERPVDWLNNVIRGPEPIPDPYNVPRRPVLAEPSQVGGFSHSSKRRRRGGL